MHNLTNFQKYPFLKQMKMQCILLLQTHRELEVFVSWVDLHCQEIYIMAQVLWKL